MSERLAAAIAAIDDANRDDPNQLTFDGVTGPKELVHAELVTNWVRELDPDADEAQLLAARAHHLRRWTIPRSDYPDGRAGYLRWRAALGRQHAIDVGEILRRCGYDDASITRVQQIVRKVGLGTDPAVQTHEDALCLTFLQTQLDALAARMDEPKLAEVLAKTLDKMSEDGQGRAIALDLGSGPAKILASVIQEQGLRDATAGRLGSNPDRHRPEEIPG